MAPVLTAKQRRAAISKKIAVHQTAGELVALLQSLTAYDLFIERRVKYWRIASTVFLFVGGFMFNAADIKHDPASRFLMTTLFGGSAVCLLVSLAIKQDDLSDNFRTVALPFLTMLREDMDPKERIHARIDLRQGVLPSKKRSVGKPYRMGIYYRVVDCGFLDPWFVGRTTLADGTRLEWNVTDRIRARRLWKRMGTTFKNKTKYMRRTIVRVKLTFSRKRFSVAPAENIRLKKESLVLKKVAKVKDDAESPAFQMLIDLIADGYRCISPIARTA